MAAPSAIYITQVYNKTFAPLNSGQVIWLPGVKVSLTKTRFILFVVKDSGTNIFHGQTPSCWGQI